MTTIQLNPRIQRNEKLFDDDDDYDGRMYIYFEILHNLLMEEEN